MAKISDNLSKELIDPAEFEKKITSMEEEKPNATEWTTKVGDGLKMEDLEDPELREKITASIRERV